MAREKAKKLMDSASRNPFQKVVYQSHLITLRMYIELLFHYQGHLSYLEDRIVTLANEMKEYKIIQLIPESEKKSLQRLSQRLVKSIGSKPLRKSFFFNFFPSCGFTLAM